LSSISSYLFIYSLLVIGTFAVTSAVVGEGVATLDSFKGLGKSNPVLALAMTVLLLAQAGVPVTSGFIAKFGVIRAAVSAESYALAIIAMVAAVVAAYLYLRIMVSMWLQDREAEGEVTFTTSTLTVVAVSVVLTVVVGLAPQFLLDFATQLRLN
jgi:NADH-quinone oxidoreductase subunit N